MICREFSAERVNAVCNDPAVFPWISGGIEGPVDFAPVIDNHENVVLFGEGGGFLFYKMARGIYDAHSAVLPSARGAWVKQASRDALDWMFSNTDAVEIMMSVPKGNLAVRALVRSLGAMFVGQIEQGWLLNGRLVTIDVFSMTKDDWQCQQHSH